MDAQPALNGHGQASASVHLELALKYAENGFAIFPARVMLTRDEKTGQEKWAKIPLIKNWEAAASTNEKQIRAWWRKFPQAAVGLPMGRNRCVAIDADRHGGPDGVAAFDQLANGACPAHPIVDTAGQGEHHIFAQPDDIELGNGEGTLPKGINVRGHGGWIVAPGTVRPDGRRWQARKGSPGLVQSIKEGTLPELPECFLEHLRPQEGPSAPSSQEPTDDKRGRAYAEATLANVTNELLGTPQGHRNNKLNESAFRLGRFVANGWLGEGEVTAALEAAALVIGLDRKEAAKTIKSALGAGVANPHPGPADRARLQRSQFNGNKPHPASELPSCSDEAIALKFADRHAAELRYTHKWGQWTHYDGKRWREDATLLAFDLARHLCREAAEEATRSEQKDTVSAKKRAAVVSLAREDRRLAATTDQWDVDQHLLNTPNGTIDLRTFERREHRANDYITSMTAVSPGGNCPRWRRFIDEVTGGDQALAQFLQRVAGYSLTGDISEHALFFWYGTGANGKSVFLNTLAGIVGDYHRTAPIETFTASKNDRHPTELAMLRGARLVTSIETEEGRRWAESRIKQLTGGEPIPARFMRQDFFKYMPTFKLLIAGNHKPSLRSVDEAIRRRFHLVPFTVTIPADKRDLNLGANLKAEWSGILQWALDGCANWRERGLSPPEAVTKATAAYLEAEDAVGAWIDERCDRMGEDSLTSLNASWRQWAEQNGESPRSNKWLAEALETRGFEPVKREKGKHILGLRVSIGAPLNTGQWAG